MRRPGPNRAPTLRWLDDPQKAREITASIRRHHGCLRAVAIDLMISRRTVYRFVHRFELWSLIDELRSEKVRIVFLSDPDDAAA